MVGELSLPPMEGVEAEEVQVPKAWLPGVQGVFVWLK